MENMRSTQKEINKNIPKITLKNAFYRNRKYNNSQTKINI